MGLGSDQQSCSRLGTGIVPLGGLLIAMLITLPVAVGCGGSAPAPQRRDSSWRSRTGSSARHRQTQPARPAGPATSGSRSTDVGDLIGIWRQGAADDPHLPALLDAAEANADPAGRQVLRTGRAMVASGEVIRGSCWTYASAVYARAGLERKQRRRVFKTDRSGPYAEADSLRPGDFLSYVNLQYNRGVHSAIFVGWLDRRSSEALMLSYVGGRRARPGDYRSYTLTHVYMVQRARLPAARAAAPSPSRPPNDVWDGGEGTPPR